MPHMPRLPFLPPTLATLTYPFSPHPAPQLFLAIQYFCTVPSLDISWPYPTINMAWSACEESHFPPLLLTKIPSS